MTLDTFSEIIDYPFEERHIEFKPDIKWEGNWKSELTKRIISMSNLRDGGWIVIGKPEQPDRTCKAEGMSQENYDSFDPDNVKAFVYSHAEPPINLTVHRTEKNGKLFVGIQVQGFDSVPTICKKNERNTLREGLIYVRSKGKPETVPIQNYSEMKEIIEIAVEKGMRNFIQKSKRAGLKFELQEGINQYEEELRDIK